MQPLTEKLFLHSYVIVEASCCLLFAFSDPSSRQGTMESVECEMRGRKFRYFRRGVHNTPTCYAKRKYTMWSRRTILKFLFSFFTSA